MKTMNEEMKEEVREVNVESKHRKSNKQRSEGYARKLYQR